MDHARSCPEILEKSKKKDCRIPSFVSSSNFVCDQCGEQFVSTQKLYYHTSRNHLAEKVACDLCAEAFSNKDLLRNHIRSKHTFDNIQCEHCSKIFNNSKAFNQHKRIVHGGYSEKHFKCDQCDKRFFDNQKLNSHKVNVHLKTRPWVCRYNCGGMAYNDRSNRNAHEKKKHGGLFSDCLLYTSPSPRDS